MNHAKKFLLFTLLLALFPGILTAQDDFKEMEYLVDMMLNNRKGMQEISKGTPAFDEALNRLKELQGHATIVQNRLDAYEIGDDLEFKQNATFLLEQFKSGSYDRKSRTHAMIQRNGLSARQLLIIMENQIEMLKEKRFSMDTEEPPFSKNIMLFKDLFLFERLLEEYEDIMEHMAKLEDDSALHMYVEKRLIKLETAAQKADAFLIKYFPEKMKYTRLSNEVPILRDYFFTVTHSSEHFIHRKANNISLAKNTTSEEQKASLYRIRKLLKVFEKALKPTGAKNSRKGEDDISSNTGEKITENMLKKKFPELNDTQKHETEETKKSVKEDKNQTVSPEIPKAEKKQAAEPPLERLDDAALHQKMNDLHAETFPADDAKEVSAEQVTRCLGTLSQKQREKYDSILAKKKRSGEQAPELSALLELKPLLSSKNFAPKKKEMVEILKKQEK